MDLAPLVEPAAQLTDAELRRYARHLNVPEIGEEDQLRLKNARVLCVGAGGLGSPALLYLAAAGVGTLGVVDDDAVDASNLQRQVIHGGTALGASKTASVAARITDLNPLVRVVENRERVTVDNALEVLAGYDLVLGGKDNFETRYLVSDACELAGVPHVWGSILRFDGPVLGVLGRAPRGPSPPARRGPHRHRAPRGRGAGVKRADGPVPRSILWPIMSGTALSMSSRYPDR